jgi:hypothetical protein
MGRPLISQLRTAISAPDGKDKPIFGICLGNQLLGLAAGCTSYKLPFGNRGQNQPVVNVLTKEAFITPQNHGFAIDTGRLPADWTPFFVNANDGTNEGGCGGRVGLRTRHLAWMPSLPSPSPSRCRRHPAQDQAVLHGAVPPGGQRRPQRHVLPVRHVPGHHQAEGADTRPLPTAV